MRAAIEGCPSEARAAEVQVACPPADAIGMPADARRPFVLGGSTGLAWEELLDPPLLLGVALLVVGAAFAAWAVTHHGDGTWEIFSDDPHVLYMCFCSGGYEERNNKVNVQVPWRTSDGEYLRLVCENFPPAAKAFKPQAIFWNWGYDGTQGDYGDMGLSPDLHAQLAREIKRTADQLCQGRLIIVLCGGSRRDLARHIIPQVIRALAT